MILEVQARINQNGNLSLGQSGCDDGAADSTHGYAKSDCVLILDPLRFPTAAPTTNLTESQTRTSAGIWNKVYTAGGAVNSFILIQPQLIARYCSATPSPPYTTFQPHGYKLTSMDLNYTVGTANATTISVAAQTETYQTNNTARANASTTPLGTVTYQNPVGTTAASLPVATQANPYQCRVLFGTPVFLTGASIPNLNIEINLVLPNTSVVTITYCALNFSYALY